MTPLVAAAPPVVVVGASVRAMAASARRAGWSVHAADLFADADLRAVAATAVRVPTATDLPWPAGLAAAVRCFPRAPWCYTGALENHPDLVDRLAEARPLAGNPGDRLRAVRDPARLARAVRAVGLGFPDTFADSAAVPGDGSFLVKPQASAGGHGIARWHGGASSGGGRLWQRLVPGRSWSAAFAIDAAGPRLFGTSRQLVGRGWCGARGFAYCGSIDVPVVSLGGPLRAALGRLGRMLADEFGLLGLVGADLVLDAAGRVHVIEVNPRPTASLELVERTTGASVAATHLAAWGLTAAAPAAPAPRRTLRWAKAVMFADRPLAVAPALGTALAELANAWQADDGGWPALADLPDIGTTLRAGGPALTVLAAGGDGRTALRVLRARVAATRAILRSESFSPPAGAAEPPPPPPAGRTA